MRFAILLALACCCVSGHTLAQKKGTEKKSSETKSAAQKDSKEDKAVSWILLTGGTVWPVSGPVIQSGAVLIKDDKIVAVGRAGEVQAPKGATVVDTTGRHVCPGFVCAASRGALGVRGANSKEKAKDRVNCFSDTMLMCLGSGITTALEAGGRSTMFAIPGTSGVFGGGTKGSVTGFVGKLTYGTIEGFELRDPAGVFMTVGSTGTQRQENVRSIEKGVKYRKDRQAWLEALAKKDDKAKEPKADPVAKGLAQVLDGKLPLFVGASSRRQIEHCLELCDRFDIPMVIHGAQEAWTIPAAIGRRPVKVLLTHRGSGGRLPRPYRSEYRNDPHGWNLRNAAILSGVGVPFGTVTIGTSVNTGLFPGRDIAGLPHEACFAVRGGASEQDALSSITLTQAEILGIDDRVGSLEAGKDADILVMDREPLDYRSFVDLAYVNGRLAYEKEKVDIWNHIQTDRSKGMLPRWRTWGPWPELKAPSKQDVGGGMK